MKTDNRPLPPDLQAQLDALDKMPDSGIDFSDAPERLGQAIKDFVADKLQIIDGIKQGADRR